MYLVIRSVLDKEVTKKTHGKVVITADDAGENRYACHGEEQVLRNLLAVDHFKLNNLFIII